MELNMQGFDFPVDQLSMVVKAVSNSPMNTVNNHKNPFCSITKNCL